MNNPTKKSIVIGKNLVAEGSNKFVIGIGGKWQKKIDLTDEESEDMKAIITEIDNQEENVFIKWLDSLPVKD